MDTLSGLADPPVALACYLDDLLDPTALVRPLEARAEAHTTGSPEVESAELAASDALNSPETDPACSGEASPHGLPCLGLTVAGLCLTVRQDQIAAVIAWPDELELADAGDALVGSINHQGADFKVVDMAAVVAPNNRRISRHKTSGACLAVLAGGAWALISEAAPVSLALDAEAIHWRTPDGSRPWLAGTAPAQGCALLDVETIVKLLESGALR